MEVKDLETYEQLQLEAALRGMTILEFAKKYGKEYCDKYFIYGKRIFTFDSNGNFLDSDYEIDGLFICAINDSLTSLKGAPKVVKGDFRCHYCSNLTSLEGAPEVIDGDFICSCCNKLPKNIERLNGVKGRFIIR